MEVTPEFVLVTRVAATLLGGRSRIGQEEMDEAVHHAAQLVDTVRDLYPELTRDLPDGDLRTQVVSTLGLAGEGRTNRPTEEVSEVG